MGSESLAFKEWVRSEGLLSIGGIANLENSVLGFDAEDYLNSLLTSPHTREPLLPALGGLPFALQQHIDDDLSNWQSFNITPKFYFNGLDLACNDRRSMTREAQKAVEILDDAWNVYDHGQGDEAVVNFGKACTHRVSHIMRYLYFYLHSKGVQVLVAPYNAAAWMAYLDETAQPSVLDGCVGSASCLVFGASRVITGFNWEQKRVFFVDLKHVLSRLMLTHEQFVDLCLLAGASILPVMPEIDSETSVPRMRAAQSVMSRAGQDGHTACIQAKDDDYLALFRKAKMAVKHMTIIYQGGEIKQLNFDSCPMDAHEFLGQRLPDELINYQTRGLIGNQVLNWRTRQEILELPPLDGGNSQTYKDLIREKLLPIRARSLAILSHSLHRWFHKQDVELVPWFAEGDKIALGIPDMALADITKDAETWHVRDSVTAQSEKSKHIDLNATPIHYAIALLAEKSFAEKTNTKRKTEDHSLLRSIPELLTNGVWRFLQDCGYINDDHTLSHWGKALGAAFAKAQENGYLSSSEREADDAIFVAFELLKLDLLSTDQMFPVPPYTGAPLRGQDADKANTLLISRVACLGKFNHAKIGYTGPLSRSLLAYHQITSAVRSSLRDLTEMHAANMMMSGSAVRIRDDFSEYTDLGARLPFNTEPDLGLALEVKSYLDELSSQRSPAPDISTWFNHVIDVQADLNKAWKLWAAVLAGVRAADSSTIKSAIKTQFEEADVWLHLKRNSASQPNGTGDEETE